MTPCKNVESEMFLLKMSIRPLSKELQKKAEDELNEVPERIQEDLKNIRDWLSTQPHIQARTDDQWLLSFLRSSKFNYERTKEKLELYSTQKKKIPEFFGNRDPFCDEIQEVLKRRIIVVLPQTADPAAPKLFMFRGSRCDPAKVNLKTIVKVMLMMMEILYLEDDNSTIGGISPLIDLQDFSYKYLAQVYPSFIRNMFLCVLYAYPTRLKRAFFVNCPAFFSIVYRLLKIFAPEKIKKRLCIYNNFNDIFKYVPQTILPKEYGGDEKSYDELADEFNQKIESYRKWFLEDV